VKRAANLLAIEFRPKIETVLKFAPSAFFESRDKLSIFFDKDIAQVFIFLSLLFLIYLQIGVRAKKIKLLSFLQSLSTGEGNQEEFYLQEINNKKEVLGENHLQVGISYKTLALYYSYHTISSISFFLIFFDRNQRGKFELANVTYKKAEEILRKNEASPLDIADLLEERAALFLRYDKYEECIPLLNTTLQLKEKFYEEENLEDKYSLKTPFLYFLDCTCL